MKDRDARAWISLQAIEYAARGASRVQTEDPAASSRTMLKNLFENLLLQLKAPAHMRPTVQADLADVPCLAQEVREKREFAVAFGHQLGMQTQSRTDPPAAPD